MKKYVEMYVNQLINNLPIAVFFFTIIFSFNILIPSESMKLEYGINAIDELISIYLYYLIRTIFFAFLVTFYGFIFVLKKLKFKQMVLLHSFMVLTSVMLVFGDPSDSLGGYLLVFGLGISVYAVVWFFVLYKERRFLKDANKILKENEKQN